MDLDFIFRLTLRMITMKGPLSQKPRRNVSYKKKLVLSKDLFTPKIWLLIPMVLVRLFNSHCPGKGHFPVKFNAPAKVGGYLVSILFHH